MRDEILSHHEMVGREKVQLQRGMNFRVNRKYSIVLMSRARNAPYRDEIDEESGTLIYEGHDVPKSGKTDPKAVDQPMTWPSGRLTANGKFFQAALDYKRGKSPELVRAYEKIKAGIWSDRGFFHLVDAKIVHDGTRKVFRFHLIPVEVQAFNKVVEVPHTRLIPSSVKVEVWTRDKGQCVLCGAKDHLHFDHEVPFSKGGSSITAENVRLLCARHNLEKSDRILAVFPWLLPVSVAASHVADRCAIAAALSFPPYRGN